MIIKNILKLSVLSILFFSLPIFFVQAQVTAKINLREFTYILAPPPKPIEVSVSDAQTAANYSPLFNIAGIPSMKSGQGENAYKPLYSKAQNLVFPLINGGIFYKLNILQYIAENKEHTAVAMLGDEFIDFAVDTINLAKTLDWSNNGGQFLDAYYFVPGNYQHYLNTDKNLQMFSSAYTANKSILFFAGISHKAPTSDPYFSEEIMSKLKTFLVMKEGSKNAFFLPTTITNLTKDNNPIAFGACYEIKPAGESNKCLNTSKEKCTQQMQAAPLMSRGNFYFAYGISCQKLDFLFKNENSQTQQASYNMLIYFHGLFTGKEASRDAVKAGFEKTVFSKMTLIKKNFITVWVDQPNTNFLQVKDGGEHWGYGIPFADIVKKSYDYCSESEKLGGDTWKWDIFNQVTIKTNLTVTIHCGYRTGTWGAVKSMDKIKVFVAGHSAGGQPANQSIGNPSVNYTVILDGLYYEPSKAAKDCSKWWAIDNGQKAIANWRTLCPNNIVKGTSSDHWQVPADLPPFLMQNTDTNVASNAPTTVADTPLPDRAKTIFKPQVAFGEIKTGVNLADYINGVYKYLLGFALFITGFIIVLGGLKYILGKPDGLAMVKNAFIGLTLLAGTHLIMKTLNPQMIELQIVEVSDIKGESIKGNTATGSSAPVSGASGATAGDDLSPNPAIQVGSGWYFPVALEDLNTSTFKYHIKSKSAGGSFGYFRRESISRPETPIHCHGGVDINTLKETTPGKVYAIADGVIIDSSNHFTGCSSGTPDKKRRSAGSITIEHKDANGVPFHVRYCEMNVNCSGAPGESQVEINGEMKTVKNDWDCARQNTAKYYEPNAVVNLRIQYPLGKRITAGQLLGNATYCGMVHFELLKNGKQYPPKKGQIGGGNRAAFWDMKGDIWTTILTELGFSPAIIAKYPTVAKGNPESDLQGKNCLDSPTALANLGSAGKNLLNPTAFLTELWNKTGALGKQKSD